MLDDPMARLVDAVSLRILDGREVVGSTKVFSDVAAEGVASELRTLIGEHSTRTTETGHPVKGEGFGQGFRGKRS
jgi:hypothetical protein